MPQDRNPIEIRQQAKELFEKMPFIAAFRNLSGRTVRYAVYRLKHSEE